jgi:PAS domain-containing protein
VLVSVTYASAAALQARLLTEAGAVMVVDHKARLVYASNQLANMLGYPPSALAKMPLDLLLPQPCCQMHGAWFKVREQPPAGNSNAHLCVT